MISIWKSLRWLLAPFALLYGLGAAFRNLLFSRDIIKSVSFDIPVISIGNLSTGGTGKTIMTEYLIRMIRQHFGVAVLSRGYKRKTGGFRLAQPNCTADDVGDEPCQIKKKFPQVPVAVGSKRVFAIPQLLGEHPETKTVLLDDAFQHRSVKPGLSILLTSYHRLFTRDYPIPMGHLREWRSGYKRADIIVVTKCPPQLPDTVKEKIKREINPLPYQLIYFSSLQYGKPYALINEKKNLVLSAETNVILIAGIASTDAMEGYLGEQFDLVDVMRFPDHYTYAIEDLWKLKSKFNNLDTDNKVIITTEKDAIRLQPFADWLKKSGLPIYCLPVEMNFENETQQLQDQVLTFIKAYK